MEGIHRSVRADRPWRAWRLCVRSFFEPVDEAGDAIFYQGNVEIDEQSQAFVSEFQIGEELLLMHRRDALQRLDLYDYRVLHYQISVKSGVDTNRLVDYRNHLLA